MFTTVRWCEGDNMEERSQTVNHLLPVMRPRGGVNMFALVDDRVMDSTVYIANNHFRRVALLRIPHPSQVYQNAVAPGYVMLQPALPYAHPTLPNQTFYDLNVAYQQHLNANAAYEQYAGFTSPGYISPTLTYAVQQAGTLPGGAASYTQYQSTPQVAGDRMQ
ncbi:hypothetical protein HOLleu_40777 [Holothuria leucospilota]|uniref:Uncharacterized protein n=1 Tax=Holothuria leucospilota TaxID=206669 RepID=A0A9Q0YDU0_HOLLE|nr:hypothetical protein HOLleu_40777 [Holothuria leucospilota]